MPTTLKNQGNVVTPFMFDYNALGNITNGPSGTYAYAGTNYANPHAATQIGSAALTYDNNGNMTAHNADTYAWDYRNRLASSTVGGVATTYGYDHANSRVTKTTAGDTTTYVNDLYTIAPDGTIKKHIMLGDTLAATVTTHTGEAPETTYIHSDHLGGTNVVTDASGNVVQVLDYYPFGSERIATGDNSTDRHFIGERFDSESGLNYLNARYYNGARGQFLNQDPAHLAIGDVAKVESVTGLAQQVVLSEPQLLNSYSYAKNNPIRYKDPEGKFVPQAVALGALYGGVAGVTFQAYSDYQSGNFSGASSYGIALGKGIVVGAAAAANPFLGIGVAGSGSLAESYVRNDGYLTAEDAVNAATEGTVTGVTAGFAKGLPQVRGAQATKVLGGKYFTGAHGTRYAQEAAFGVGVDVYRSNVSGITSSLMIGGQTQGGSSNNSIIKQLQSIMKSLQGIVSSLKDKNK